jgi:hypothetical protein
MDRAWRARRLVSELGQLLSLMHIIRLQVMD